MTNEERAEAHLEEGEALVACTDTDIDRRGRFGRRWLAVTDRRLFTLGEGPQANGVEREWPLGEISELRTVHHVGKMTLEALIDGRAEEVLACTNSHTGKFAKICHGVTAHRKKGRPLEIGLEDEKAHHCESCGRMLPDAESFCPACIKKSHVLRRFWTYMKPYWRTAATLSGCVILGTVLHLAPPQLIKILTDDVLLGGGSRLMLLGIVAALAGTHLGGTLLEVARGRLSAWLSSRVMHDIRFDFYSAVQGLSLRRYDKTQTGSLISRLTGDTQMLNFVFTALGSMIVPSMLQLVGICAMLFYNDWKLALLVLVPTPLLVLLTLLVFRRLRRAYHKLWQRRAKMTARATDAIAGIRVVKAFSQEPREVDSFGFRSDALALATATAEGLSSTYFPFLHFVTMTGTFLVWYFGGLGVVQGDVGLGTLMAFLMYIAMFYGPLYMLTRFSDSMNRAFTAAQRLFEITDSDQEIYEDPNAQPLGDLDGAVEFKEVEFSYLKDRPVLKGASFRVEAGEMIGLVGRSGVGKTTITNLICRFYDVDEGAIEIDGVDLRNLRLRDLRRHIGIVPQESYLFDGTIFENIVYAKPGASRDDVIRVAQAAHAHGFIMRLPDGYDTRVGERGARLSGGEKQRIAIARAILHDPKILILDEATSSVDTETEELIQEALQNLVKNRTTFAIAHRLSTLRNANRLLVIDDGKVAEYGAHDELLKKKGIYHMLVEMQSRLSSVSAVGG